MRDRLVVFLERVLLYALMNRRGASRVVQKVWQFFVTVLLVRGVSRVVGSVSDYSVLSGVKQYDKPP